MAEYIERGALLEKAVNGIVAAIDVLYAPAADVAPVVHGRWEDVYGGKYQNKRYRCTVCQEKALFKFYQDELLSWHDEQKLSNYCPNCGANMKDGAE
jgi:hypothetical protein